MLLITAQISGSPPDRHASKVLRRVEIFPRLTQLDKTSICTRGMTCYCPIHLGQSSRDSNNLSKALNSQGFIFPAKHCYNLLSSLTTFCIHTSYTSWHMHNTFIHFKNHALHAS